MYLMWVSLIDLKSTRSLFSTATVELRIPDKNYMLYSHHELLTLSTIITEGFQENQLDRISYLRDYNGICSISL